MTETDLVNMIGYHPGTAPMIQHHTSIRRAALDFGIAILRHCPPGPDQTAAIRKLREAMMTANAAIAIADGPPIDPRTDKPVLPAGHESLNVSKPGG